MININEFPTISELADIENNFRVFAGPGAGKTTWLIQHLEQVLKYSNRLGSTRKIACITYTNVATEEIRNGLKCDKSRFDISTIHSFLYRNIVKPFSFLIANDENGEMLFDIKKLNGHDEHIPHNDKIRRWLVTIGQMNKKNYNLYNAPENKQKVIEELASIDYSFIGENIELVIRKHFGAKIPQNNGELWIYKKKYWHDGIMHHEDVLYFSYIIIQIAPRVLEFIRNKFPYIFIDEFQDTTELQTWIIRRIADKETRVGVIGDLVQSIYKFAGAKRNDFENFDLERIKNFKIEKNHRSTKKIINFLNHLREDIIQRPTEATIEGNEVRLLIGSIIDVKIWLERNGFSNVFILTRKNDVANQIQNEISSKKLTY
ncbi:MAG: ATP-dependent helicase [Ignavibacteriales bacterium]|nr:ATP-dependent helicase [Ignavibacteriales bacterium]